MNIKKATILCFLMALAAFISDDALAQKKKKKNKKDQPKIETPAKQDKGTKNRKGGIQPYEKVITKDAVSDEGLFTVHRVDDKYFFEIPDSLMGREMLMVSRIAKTAYGLGFGGEKTNTQVLIWDKRENKKNVLLKVRSYGISAADSLPVNQAVSNSNLEPILASFPIKALSKDSAGVVLDVTSLFTKDNKPLGLPKYRRTQYKVTRLDEARSYIDRISSYPLNVEIRHVKTYLANQPPSNSSGGSITIEMSNSMVLLPKEPMKRRYADRRVGWFTTSTTDYGLDVQRSKTVRYLDRWRLEVKEEDMDKFKKGELVTPKKQIVYYIDPATPLKWRKYIKQGIEDWQPAFEKSGFKNAILAKDAPMDDPDWSPEDIRYSVVRYFASPIPNAYGPHVSDPRSGEILESDIGWFHNVMTLLRRWYFVQTAAINPEAQRPEFKEEVMGRLIRFVSAHEVGHTLGLPHNFASSVAYPVDSLRSASFTQQMGTAPSIMDYARFNYVAQPEDKGVALMPNVGVYDKYAITWGYRPIPEAVTAEDEKEILNRWIEEHAGDPLYRYGRQGNMFDHTSQSEDLGDDAMKASLYGIRNLKRIVPNLQQWTYEDSDPYLNLEEMYNEVFSQFGRYMGHVTKYVGGIKEDYKTVNQEGAIYSHASKAKQQEAIQFLNKHLFQTPVWLIDNEILSRLDGYGAVEKIRTLQVRSLNSLLDWQRFARLIENETLNGAANAYTTLSLFSDVRKGIWGELENGSAINTYRRNLQRAHIERLETLMTEEYKRPAFWFGSLLPNFDASQSDVRAIVRKELKVLRSQVRTAIPKTRDRMSKYHLEDVVERIDLVLDPK